MVSGRTSYQGRIFFEPYPSMTAKGTEFGIACLPHVDWYCIFCFVDISMNNGRRHLIFVPWKLELPNSNSAAMIKVFLLLKYGTKGV
jgi:hypothetical protein